MKVKENLLEEYNDRQVEIAKYELNNLRRLNDDLSEVVQAIMKSYARFGEMPTPIRMLSQEDFNAVEDLCIEIQNKFDYATTYLYDLISDVDDYYKPYDYQQHKKTISAESLDLNLKKFIAEEVDDVEVCKGGLNDEVEYGFIKNNDLSELSDTIGRSYNCIKTFKSIK